MRARDVVVVEADLARPDHQRAVVEVTAAYARDPMGNGGPLPARVLEDLIPGLRAHPTTLVLLAFVGEDVAGIATCFLGFSTFAARPLLNVHDLCVLEPFRGRGIGRALLGAAEASAARRGCVKLSLEVQEHNARARRLYESVGFSQAVANPINGGALYYTKPIVTAPLGPPGADVPRAPGA